MFKLTRSGQKCLDWLLAKYESPSGLSGQEAREMEALSEIHLTGFMEELDWDTVSSFLRSRYIKGKDV